MRGNRLGDCGIPVEALVEQRPAPSSTRHEEPRLSPHTLLFIAPVGLLLSACASLPNERHITIDSQPPGATVLASGREVGITPLRVRADDIFPPRWKNMHYAVSGTLTLRKPGCEPYALAVNDPVLSKDIQAELVCSDVVESSAPASAAAAQDPVEARLARIRALYERGVITETEYRHARTRVLGQL